MVRKFKRPRTREELEQLEAEGLWKATIFSKKIGESSEKITLEAILKIHGVIFQFVSPEIKGRFRGNGEDIKKVAYMEPPLGRLVQERTYEFAREQDVRISENTSGNPLVRIFALGYIGTLERGDIHLSPRHTQMLWGDPKTFKPADYFKGGWLAGVEECLKLKM